MNRPHILSRIAALALLFALVCPPAMAADPQIDLPRSALTAAELAVVVNDADPLSIAIARYYQQRRKIPDENIIRVVFKPGAAVMSAGEFAVLQKQVERQTPASVQAYVLTWAAPYRVNCMSITSAFALGYDVSYCAQGCLPTRASPYAGRRSLEPWKDHGLRPTMMLAAATLEDAIKLIDRGIAADGSWPEGSAYLVETSDPQRSVRLAYFPAVQQQLAERLPIKVTKTDALREVEDVLFYFTGRATVDALDSNRYLPGAMADHLTSTGGQLTDSAQMSALRWLEAGATGSYGTVVEPCNLLEKFPNPLWAIKAYTEGASLLEAYWKSVRMPGQGVFIGEPLATPWRAYRLRADGSFWRLLSPVLTPGNYTVNASGGDAQQQWTAIVSEPGELRFPAGFQHYRVTRNPVFGAPPWLSEL